MSRDNWKKSALGFFALLGLVWAVGLHAQQGGQAPAAAPPGAEGRGAGAGAAAGAGARGGRGGGPGAQAFPPLFFKEDFQRPADTTNAQGQVPVVPQNISNANLELHVYGIDAKNNDPMHVITISGNAGSDTMPFNLWTGLCANPVAATLRDKNNYVDLTGLAKIRWVTRASGYHDVRPVVKLADGTMLVGDHVDHNTTTFLMTEVTFTGMRWIKLDPDRVVTTGTYGGVGEASSWVTNPDLSKVDEIGFADLMPGTGHGSGGWVNVAHIEVYGKSVPRTGATTSSAAAR